MKHCDGKDFDFLIGKKILKVIDDVIVENDYGKSEGFILICDDNTEIRIATNEGCGGCSNGWSSFEDLKKLESNHNIITNVKCEYSKEQEYEFKLFIYCQDDILEIKGDDGYGNGYYGGGFYVTIKDIKAKENK